MLRKRPTSQTCVGLGKSLEFNHTSVPRNEETRTSRSGSGTQLLPWTRLLHLGRGQDDQGRYVHGYLRGHRWYGLGTDQARLHLCLRQRDRPYLRRYIRKEPLQRGPWHPRSRQTRHQKGHADHEPCLVHAANSYHCLRRIPLPKYEQQWEQGGPGRRKEWGSHL